MPASHPQPDSSLSGGRRQPAEIRIRQILDAALAEFSTHGFLATRIEDIASRAGLSKGAIYNHFKSKDEVLQALLEHALTPPATDIDALLSEPMTPQRIAQVIEETSCVLTDASTQALVRLMISERNRLASTISAWRHTVVDRYMAALDQVLDQGVKQGALGPGAVNVHATMLIAPALQTLMMQLMFGPMSAEELQGRRTAHVWMIRELLTPREAAPGSAQSAATNAAP